MIERARVLRRRRRRSNLSPTSVANQTTMTAGSYMYLAKILTLLWVGVSVESKLADRSRVVRSRHDSGTYDRYHDNGRPIEGQSYRSTRLSGTVPEKTFSAANKKKNRISQRNKAPWKLEGVSHNGDPQMFSTASAHLDHLQALEQEDQGNPKRKLSSQLTGCCYNYENYGASDLCAIYGQDCETGETPSHDSGDDDCEQEGLSFIGVSFSVNTASGNPYSYQLNDQFPMENIIDRDYEYVMSMDEDGWLVGGGYKTFDYSGKMP
jgi:hypothetical protein